MSSRAEGIAERYIEDKYNVKFTIEDIYYSKQLGQSSGEYLITAHPDINTEVSFQITDHQNMTSPEDDYLEYKWRWELNKEVEKLLTNTYSSDFNFMANVVFPPTAVSNFSANNTYQDVVSKDSKNIGNYIYINILSDPSNNIEEELTRLFKIILELKYEKLRDFSLDVRYYEKTILQDLKEHDHQLTYHQFTNQYFQSHGALAFSFDTRNSEHAIKLLAIRSPKDLEEYLIDFNK